MKKLLLVPVVAMLGVLVSGMLSGCTTYYKDVAGDYLNTPGSAATSPYYTQYDIDKKKVEGRGEATVIFGFFHFGENKYCRIGANPNLTIGDIISEFFSPSAKAVANAKASSLYDICESNDTDFLVGTTFQYTITNALVVSMVKCKTTAYPARVRDVGIASPIILNRDQRIEYVNPNMPLKDYSKAPTLKIEAEK